MGQIADWMDRVAAACTREGKEYRFNQQTIAGIRGEVCDLCTSGEFPVPGIDV
jgi:hypothetical protein